MSSQFHGVVEDPADQNTLRLDTVDHKVAGAPHHARLDTRSLATQVEVPGTNALTQLGALNTARPRRLMGKVPQGGGQKCLIAHTGRFSEPLMRPAKNVADIVLRGGGENIAHG